MQMLGRFRSADGENDFSSAGFHQTQLDGEIDPERLRELDDGREQPDVTKMPGNCWLGAGHLEMALNCAGRVLVSPLRPI